MVGWWFMYMLYNVLVFNAHLFGVIIFWGFIILWGLYFLGGFIAFALVLIWFNVYFFIFYCFGVFILSYFLFFWWFLVVFWIFLRFFFLAFALLLLTKMGTTFKIHLQFYFFWLYWMQLDGWRCKRHGVKFTALR